ncbi:hypothetical protein AVM11_03360 [Sphingomonas melonis TY]|jgi:hypothetical protein|uniref:Uncharacterized protein n=1 Tax=Sphingomonas melonis TY TaxID=621456 RepID=A0A175Y4G3_9SPHN|nr:MULTISPECIES: hypothetical protein [Sphingomonas]AOW22744.1 hypothetical protein BJP26_03470 [Sphingomonas melonis TY]ATI56149.1 hypothetical protein CP552_10765 [Sphingomonas melonis]KZB95325.1 hypothetical protein AVM11_03360 [Sphingomonas melonis TY]MBI0530782.1 hypothetical protein [Sphingomonas sp. TX0522]MBX8845134.1 hypothetical protein [Sphingomonas melonis]
MIAPRRDYRAAQADRGYQPSYVAGTACPGCGHRAWLLGRRAAECGRCGTALPLAPEVAHG